MCNMEKFKMPVALLKTIYNQKMLVKVTESHQRFSHLQSMALYVGRITKKKQLHKQYKQYA